LPTVKIATFNINGVNKRITNLLEWLAVAQPDAVALQEIKCRDADFPFAALDAAGYGAVVRGQGSHHGVAILARGATPLETRRDLPGLVVPAEARYLEAAVNGVLVACLYAPNGNPQPGPKFDAKLAWLACLVQHAAALRAERVPALLAGDFNIVPTDFDIYGTRSNAGNALLQPEPRRLYALLLEHGWTDALRTMYPRDPMYTFWYYYRDAWKRNAGWRLDHLLLGAGLADRLTAAGVDHDVRGRDGASDHAPAWIELRD
jgi:exodeoxyribonuclease-3